MSTLHFKDSELEIHKVVVGPMDNNVFVIRCKQTGEGLLIDAANEHELLLDLCKELNVQSVIETHGHWDHIQAVPQVRDAGYSVHVTQADAHMLESYDEILEDESVINVGRVRLETILTPGHTPGSMCFKVKDKPILLAGIPYSLVDQVQPNLRVVILKRSSTRLRGDYSHLTKDGCFAWPW